MLRSGSEKKRVKKGLLRICYVSEAALSVAAGVFGWKTGGATMLGAAIATPLVGLAREAINEWDVDTDLDEEYFLAVEAALKATERHFRNQSSKLDLLRELSGCGSELDIDSEKIIERTEAYQTKYLTKIDTREILDVFEPAFAREVISHDRLSRYYSIKTGRATLDLLKSVYVLVSADNQKLDQIFEYVKRGSEDTALIKEDIQQVKNGVDYLKNIGQRLRDSLRFVAEIFVQSMIIFFAFTVATAFLDVQSNDSMMIYAIVLISEFVIRFLLVRVRGLRTAIAVIATQSLFIITSSLLITHHYIGERPEALFYITGCAFTGVITKYFLLYLRRNHPDTRCKCKSKKSFVEYQTNNHSLID